MPNGEHMSYLMACCLHCPVLNFPRDFWSENPLRLCLTRKVWVVSSVALDTDPPALLSHSKNKSPPIFWVEVCIGQHQKTLIIFQLYIFLKIVKDMPCMELFYLSVRSNTSADDLFILKNRQAWFHTWTAIRLLNSESWDPTEENFENRLHIVDKHFLEISFLLT